jgi:hypothetical protein
MTSDPPGIAYKKSDEVSRKYYTSWKWEMKRKLPPHELVFGGVYLFFLDFFLGWGIDVGKKHMHLTYGYILFFPLPQNISKINYFTKVCDFFTNHPHKTFCIVSFWLMGVIDGEVTYILERGGFWIYDGVSKNLYVRCLWEGVGPIGSSQN